MKKRLLLCILIIVLTALTAKVISAFSDQTWTCENGHLFRMRGGKTIPNKAAHAS